MPVQVAGLDLVCSETDESWQPLAALAVVKTFEPEGDAGVGYSVRATEGLSTVECLGMAELAVIRLRASLTSSDGDDDDG